MWSCSTEGVKVTQNQLINSLPVCITLQRIVLWRPQVWKLIQDRIVYRRDKDGALTQPNGETPNGSRSHFRKGNSANSPTGSSTRTSANFETANRSRMLKTLADIRHKPMPNIYLAHYMEYITTHEQFATPTKCTHYIWTRTTQSSALPCKGCHMP